ncbi:hypothetical protein COV82_02735 [Candidatus Peregrinibacteria bacterium CG11_big_fil_rev_8_21_14_0_20_46_8]|nr:MAG: hypothetical protein COV82_02735 [Candidatus Peregrinibacteria bacterium CG11_big_fil_rev_8_21_14_0_20_46_8]
MTEITAEQVNVMIEAMPIAGDTDYDAAAEKAGIPNNPSVRHFLKHVVPNINKLRTNNRLEIAAIISEAASSLPQFDPQDEMSAPFLRARIAVTKSRVLSSKLIALRKS